MTADMHTYQLTVHAAAAHTPVDLADACAELRADGQYAIAAQFAWPATTGRPDATALEQP
jgi:hypothetical protein